MRLPPAIATALVAATAVACAGCRLVRGRGPVAPDVAESRRLCNEGLSAADREDLVRADGLLERAVERCPVDVDARRHYADVLWRRGERMEAVRQVSAALELSPADAALCVEASRMYLDLGLLNDAERLATEAVRLAPRSAAAWHAHGRVALARGQAEAALADFHRALAVAPLDRDVLRDTAEAYLRLDRPQRALATLAVLDETFGPDQLPADVLVLEGAAQEALGRPGDAAVAYRRAVARGDAPADARARLAALESAAAAAAGAPVIR